MPSDKENEKRRAGLTAFLFFAAAAAIIVLIVGWAEAWDRVFVARENPQAEDAYVWSTERPLQARVAGYITSVPVDDNQTVRAGQLIATIEDDNYRASVEQAQAGLLAAQAMLQSLIEQRDAAEIAVAASKAREVAARAQQHFADQEAARQRHILHSDLGLLRAAQQADAAQRAQAATTGEQQVGVDTSDRRVDVLAARIELQRARIEAQQARLDLARIDLGYTAIRAPVAGSLGTRQVHVGDLVTTGRTVVELTPLDDVWVMAFFKDTQLTDIRLGQAVAARFDAFPGTEIIGRVDQVAPITLQQTSLVEPDNTTGNYTKVVQRVEVKIVFDPRANPLLGRVRPGMSALVRVRTGAPVDVVRAR